MPEIFLKPLFIGPLLLGLMLGATLAFGLSRLLQKVALKKAVECAKKEARKEALASQRATLKGQISEQLAPWFPNFPYLAADARFIGAPIDLLVFDGLSEPKNEVTVVLVELKTGKAQLSQNERRVRDAIKAGRVRFEKIRLDAQNKS